MSDGRRGVFVLANGRRRAFFHSGGKVAFVIDEFKSDVKSVRVVFMASFIIAVEMPSKPVAFDEERFTAWRTSASVTGRRQNCRPGGRASHAQAPKFPPLCFRAGRFLKPRGYVAVFGRVEGVGDVCASCSEMQ